jgi:creatinine amidohydrolase
MMNIEEMTWPKFQEAIERDDLILLPVGSTEEHGPQSPLGTDDFIAQALARRIGEKAGALVAPGIPIGNASGLASFPGTISIDTEVLERLILEVCENYIRHSARRFLFVNGHGGNNVAIRAAARELFDRYGALGISSEWWMWMPKISQYQAHDHGGQYETSMMMAVNEQLVDLTKARTVQIERLTDEITFDYGFWYKGAPLSLNIPTRYITPTGNFGAPSELASREIGDGMFEAYTDYAAALADEMRRIDLGALRGGKEGDL